MIAFIESLKDDTCTPKPAKLNAWVYIYRDGLVDYLTNFKFSVVKMISSCKLYRSTLAVAGSDHK